MKISNENDQCYKIKIYGLVVNLNNMKHINRFFVKKVDQIDLYQKA